MNLLYVWCAHRLRDSHGIQRPQNQLRGVFLRNEFAPRYDRSTIFYRDITTNIGNALGTNGIFTAPVDGIYSFELNLNKKDSTRSEMWVTLRKNTNTEVARSYCPSNSYTSPSYSAFCAASIILKLNKNDTIIIGLISDDYAKLVHFSGFLIEQQNLIWWKFDWVYHT